MCVAKVSACVAYWYASLIFWARKQTAGIVSSLFQRGKLRRRSRAEKCEGEAALYKELKEKFVTYK